MSTIKPKFALNQEVETFRYRGPDRRNRDPEIGQDGQPIGDVRFDAKGNPVWELRLDIPRRRKDDDTVDLLKCLDVDLAIEEEEAPSKPPGFDPYARDEE